MKPNMKVAVKFYGSTDNPEGLPDHWPMEVTELEDGAVPPAGCVVMTVAEYHGHRRAHARDYDHWHKNLRKPGAVERALMRSSRPETNWIYYAAGAACALGVLYYLGVIHG